MEISQKFVAFSEYMNFKALLHSLTVFMNQSLVGKNVAISRPLKTKLRCGQKKTQESIEYSVSFVILLLDKITM